MRKSDQKVFNEQLLVAKALLKLGINTAWDLAHYMADNGIGKIMMYKLHHEKDSPKKEVQKYKFPELLENFQKEYQEISIDYEEIKKQRSSGRNPFQHHLKTIELGIRRQHAEEYVSIFESLLDKIGILDQDPNFLPRFVANRNNLDDKRYIEDFISYIEEGDFDDLISRCNHDKFISVLKPLFMRIDNRSMHLSLFYDKDIRIMIIAHENKIKFGPFQKDGKITEFVNHSYDEKTEIFLNRFKKRVEKVYGFSI